MVATNEKVQFDFNADFGDSNYKSCFARSVAVNSQFQSKSLDLRQLQKVNKDEQDKRNCTNNTFGELEVGTSVPTDFTRIRKDSQHSLLLQHPAVAAAAASHTASAAADDKSRRLSCCSSSSSGGGTAAGFAGGGRTSRRGSDLPVENLALQSQVDALQWQLKQAEASREMYRAVMQQVVGFLERAHRSLDALGERQRSGVQRSRSEYHVAAAVSTHTLATSPAPTTADITTSTPQQQLPPHDGYAAFRDFTWRRPKRQQTGPDEVPPEKLSQEAFRLLRTAQSLLNTREPDLAHISTDIPPKDQEFLTQLAREFPSRPQRATSFSINPQLISPSDREIRIQTAFNRKLSLQRTPVSESRRDSLRQENGKKHDLPRNLDNDYCLMTSNITSNDADSTESKRSSVTSISCVSSLKKIGDKSYFDSLINSEKASSPKTGSVSSAEDESGFSSMNSFQEVGLPIVNSTLLDNESFLKNGDISVNSSDSNITQINVDTLHSDSKGVDKAKLIWNRSDLGLPITHRRWSSIPVEVTQHDPLKVLWV